ncbi:MAG: winged helix DNA-binding protein [Rhizobiales bacterium]|nr:winged helix DNA-binding protein [Hyphomicrobiales bacterium]
MTSEEKKKRKIVSSRHLATSDGWQLSEFEYGLIIAFNGFSRWTTKCMNAAGSPNLTPLEILVLHNINHRAKQKKLSDITFLLNIEDSHVVNYALKKLLKAELIEGEKQGKEMFYSTTKTGIALCESYRDIREQCLLESLSHMNRSSEEISEIAAALRTLSGLYDQASRSASSL